MKLTRYFEEQVLRKRPYLTYAMCTETMKKPIARIVQEDGRIRFWGSVLLQGEGQERILRVITLEDGETVHNAFFDRNFKATDV